MLSFDNIVFDYEPYPIGVATPAVEPSLYAEMLAAWPPLDLFLDTGKHGRKLSLSRKNRRADYERYVADTPVWREFRRYIESDAFIHGTLEMLRRHNIDLGLDARALGRGRRALDCLSQLARGRLPTTPPALAARFEFSALPADGGEVLPHTDTQKKMITVVLSMLEAGEWPDGVGGGTDVLRPKDPRQAFNQVNRQLGHDEVETLKTFEYRPNQAVLFIKTYNSLHGVRPMTGKDSGLWRRTLTVNILRSH